MRTVHTPAAAILMITSGWLQVATPTGAWGWASARPRSPPDRRAAPQRPCRHRGVRRQTRLVTTSTGAHGWAWNGYLRKTTSTR
ncbi:hypothetical protein [Nonomuraea sp. NPDC001699]